jgi:hypothetical protein
VPWSGVLIPLVIVLVYAWPYLARFIADTALPAAPPKVDPPKPSPALEEFRRKLAGVDLRDLMPPNEVHASEPWDKYWRLQFETGVWGFNDMFIDDRALVRAMDARGFRTVLCVGAGLSLEPHALVAAGFAVTMLDISRDVVTAMRSGAFKPEAFDRILYASQLRPGGTLECVAGDLMDATLCPGPYDVVIERKTLQLFPQGERGAALAAVAARMNPHGVLFTHVHDGGAGPTRPGTHYVEPFLAGCGFVRGTFESSSTTGGRTAVTFLSTG